MARKKPTAASVPRRPEPSRPRAKSRPPEPAGGQVRIAILSRNKKLYSTRRLVEAARALGHKARVLDTLRCNMVLARDAPRLTYRGEDVTGIDVVIPRIGASITGYGLSVVNQFDMMGVPVLNTAVAIARSRIWVSSRPWPRSTASCARTG